MRRQIFNHFSQFDLGGFRCIGESIAALADQKNQEGRGNPFVAVDKRVIPDDRINQRRAFFMYEAMIT
jgi:hypothetical protein